MSCNTSLNGIADDCENIYGGITDIWIEPKINITASTIATGELTAITATGSGPVHYAFKEGAAIESNTSAIDFATSTTVFENLLTITFKGDDLALRTEFMLLLKGQQEYVVYYRLDTGVYKVIGLTNGTEGKHIGARVSELAKETGATRADANQYNFTIKVEKDKELPLFVASALAATLLV